MRLITADWESYYDSKSGYTLTKMSTEDYVCDPRFEEISIAVRVDDLRTEWFTGTRPDFRDWLKRFEIHKNALVAHNMMFDGLIFAHHYDIYPKMYIDTLSMARPIFGSFLKSLSLASLVRELGLGEKGDEVIRADGKRRKDFTPTEMHTYGGVYGVNDVDLTYALFRRLRAHMRPGVVPANPIKFPDEELYTIDATMRMYTQPELELALPVLQENLVEVRQRKAKILAEMEVQGITGAVLRSNEKFAALLDSKGVEVPLKPSPTSLKRKDDPVLMTYAFGKNDEQFKAMQEEYGDDLEISTILNARISEKSTMEETRTVKLIAIAEKYPKLRVPISYCAAHTNRDGGTEGINLQNPPKVDKSRMRFAIVAPGGHVLVDLDQNAVEARLTGVLAGCERMTEQFARNEDIYSAMASDCYGRPVDRKKVVMVDGKKTFPDYTPGQAGKGCVLGLGFGMQAEKFRVTLAGQYGVKVDIETAEKWADIYHGKYPEIRELHQDFESALKEAVRVSARRQIGPIEVSIEGLTFPNGTRIAYPNLGINKRGRLFYRRAKDKYDQTMFGGKATENAIQKLARDVVFWQANTITRETGFKHVLRGHDALAYVIPISKADAFKAHALEIMSRRPSYLPDAPLLAEAKIGDSYGATS